MIPSKVFRTWVCAPEDTETIIRQAYSEGYDDPRIEYINLTNGRSAQISVCLTMHRLEHIDKDSTYYTRQQIIEEIKEWESMPTDDHERGWNEALGAVLRMLTFKHSDIPNTAQ